MISLRARNQQFSLRRLALIGLFSFILVVGIAPIGRLGSSGASIQYNNVQVFIQTQGTGLSPYTLTAYNSSGSLISSSQSNYPAFSLELPSGTYLLTVTAVNQSSTRYYWSYSTEEYGYQLVQISSSTTLDMKTIPLQDISTSKITIQVKYVNGTLASGAWLDASIVGLMYWWPFPTPYASGSISLWNQTDSSGSATLTVPSVPVIVSAWKSVYVNLPTNQTTVVRNIGGENVNVTVFWEPMYVGLSGQTLIIPPSTSGEITLHVEQIPYYWYGGGVPIMGTATVVGAPGVYSTATVANSPSMIPGSAYNQQQQMQASGNRGIPPTGTSQGSSVGSFQPTQIPQILQVNQPATPLATTDLIIAISAIGALILAAVSFAVVIIRGRKHLAVG